MNNKLQTCVYIKEMKHTVDNVQIIYTFNLLLLMVVHKDSFVSHYLENY